MSRKNKDEEKEEQEAASDEEERKADVDQDGEATGGKRKRKRKRKKKSAEEEEEASNDNAEDKSEYDASKDMVEHTVYVEGIPFDATPDQVKEFFVKGGIQDVVELRLPTWQDSGRLRGYGHVLFGSKESFAKALKLSGGNMGMRYLTIQAANTPRNNHAAVSSTARDEPPPKDCRTLYVNNLPYNAETEEIVQVFEKACGVTIPDDGVRIARNSVTRQSKGFCYIDFESPQDAQTVMKSKKRLTVQGRLLRLDWDTGRMKGSYRADSGRLWTKEIQEKKKSRHH